jgi:hypothetical protein
MDIAGRYSNEFLDLKRTCPDGLADDFIAEQFSDPSKKNTLKTWLDQLNSNSQLYFKERSMDSLPDDYRQSKLVLEAAKLPEWADPALMKMGAAFFGRNAEAIMNLLGLLSLPYCYAAADGAMVLYFSERIRNETGKRLGETADFIWDVMSPEAFGKLGRGFSSILQVRLMHAGARYYTLASGRWEAQWGLPLNQEDMAGTNLAFSLIVIRGLRKLGYTIQYEEQQAFIHLWNVIGHLLGVQQDLLPETGKQAQLLEAAIRKRQFKASVQGAALTQALTSYLIGTMKNEDVTSEQLLGFMRFLLGDQVADLLDLKAPKLTTSQLWLLKTVYLVKTSSYHQALRTFKKQSQLT